LTGNRTYFAAIKSLQEQTIIQSYYKTLIRPVVTYGVETRTMTKKEEQAKLIFERKLFRRIYGLNMKMGNGKVGRIENSRS
jgi:hypothetical protein